MRLLKCFIFTGVILWSRQAIAQSIPQTTCNTLSVSSSTVTEMTGNTTNIATSSATWFVTVMNLDTTNNLYCSHDSAVATSGTHQGVPILSQATAATPFNWFGWQIGITQPWYCKAAIASITAVVCRAH